MVKIFNMDYDWSVHSKIIIGVDEQIKVLFRDEAKFSYVHVSLCKSNYWFKSL